MHLLLQRLKTLVLLVIHLFTHILTEFLPSVHCWNIYLEYISRWFNCWVSWWIFWFLRRSPFTDYSDTAWFVTPGGVVSYSHYGYVDYVDNSYGCIISPITTYSDGACRAYPSGDVGGYIVDLGFVVSVSNGRIQSPSRRSTDNTFFIYADGEVSSDIWIVVDSYGHASSLRSRLISTLRGLSILPVVSAASASTMSTIPTATSPDTSDAGIASYVHSSGDVNYYGSNTVFYSYGIYSYPYKGIFLSNLTIL